MKSIKDKDELKEKINKHRKEKRDGGDTSAKPLKITKFKEQKTTREVSRELYGAKNKKAENKITNRTRQRLHRLKS